MRQQICGHSRSTRSAARGLTCGSPDGYSGAELDTNGLLAMFDAVQIILRAKT